MRYFWIALAFFCVIALLVMMFFENLPALVHNIFYRTKRPICWDPRIDARRRIELDESENFYH